MPLKATSTFQTTKLRSQVSYNEIQWGLTFSQVVWLLGLLNCSNSTKNIHETRNKKISLVSLLLSGSAACMKDREGRERVAQKYLPTRAAQGCNESQWGLTFSQ
eukprot:1160317-Pelagomonas_calceolata.AAC.1